MIPLRVKFRCQALARQEFSEVGSKSSKNTQVFG